MGPAAHSYRHRAVWPGRAAVPAVRRRLWVRCPQLARLSGAARDPRTDHDDVDYAERRREPGCRRRVQPAGHLTARKRFRTCLELLLISPATTPAQPRQLPIL